MANTDFLPRSEFEPTGEYTLMPFRFQRWIDGTVFLTNSAGEHLALSSESFSKFVKKTLPASSPAYMDLLARQMLRDSTGNWGHDIFASKWFTKKSFLDGFTKLHIFVTTLRCNQSCPYCQVSRQGEAADSGAFDMSPEILETSIRFMLASPSDRVTMEFQGGEPLLRFDLLQEAVRKTKELNEKVGKHIDYVLCSNLAILEDRHLEWCRTEGVIISTSLDGPEYLHNKNRPMGNGRASHEIVTRNIRRAQEALGKHAVSALMTTTCESLKFPTEIVDEYLRMDMGSVFVRELNPYGFAVKSAAALGYSSNEFFRFYKRIFDYIVQINKSGRTFSESFASIVLTKALTPWAVGFVDLQSPAGAGFGVCVYNYDGDVYVSDEARMLAEAGDPTFRLGSVLEDSYDDIFFGETMQTIAASACSEALPGCSDCAYQPYCGADPVRNYRTQGDPVGSRPGVGGFCRRNKQIIEYLMQLVHTADDDLTRILWAWICQEDVNTAKLPA
jgi:uncharacterized protein